MKNEDFIEKVFHLVFGKLYWEKEMTLFPIQEMFTREEVLEELGNINPSFDSQEKPKEDGEREDMKKMREMYESE